MDNTPKTRTESKKNQRQKGRQDRLGSSKSVRKYEAMLERKGVSAPPAAAQNNKKKT